MLLQHLRAPLLCARARRTREGSSSSRGPANLLTWTLPDPQGRLPSPALLSVMETYSVVTCSGLPSEPVPLGHAPLPRPAPVQAPPPSLPFCARRPGRCWANGHGRQLQLASPPRTARDEDDPSDNSHRQRCEAASATPAVDSTATTTSVLIACLAAPLAPPQRASPSRAGAGTLAARAWRRLGSRLREANPRNMPTPQRARVSSPSRGLACWSRRQPRVVRPSKGQPSRTLDLESC
mmetsp:Transcript_29603/g.94813  ORF Transcript_29603/g.94813 Transcript_29603/m.94813 type:complete len:237 (+) Transcript_29603:297-1007(+)